MSVPLLQVALDHVSFDEALSAVELVRDDVDVVEAGTILCYSEGMRAVEAVRKAAPNHILVADLKIADAREWLAMGVSQAIYHRGRDAQAAGRGWGQADLDAMKRLSDSGIELSVIGGVTADQVGVFRNIAVKCFIAGRGLYACADPGAAARSFKAAIADAYR